MRRSGILLLLSALLGALAVVVAGPAAACSCAGGTTIEQLERADAVFTGRLISRTPGDGGSSASPAVHLFEVEMVVKGQVLGQQEVLSPDSGASCGIELPERGPVAVFASRSTDLGGTPFATLAEDQYAAFLCDGTAPLTPLLEAELEALLPAGATSPAQPPPTQPAVAQVPVEGRPPIAQVLAVLLVVGGGLVLARWRVGPGRRDRA
ncbi:hypothetical protein [Blastococcus sp. TF02A-30]|uniref:hypothetical protein n=1 Tax=Blastococcus sp. TF02A-30 TaxID=2250580 RepID=UPI000DEB6A8E|nr:hypothetical protein [Blastococcus sp. TF02A-30]RBY92853.1 hypothetical protein DQ241_02055 [Blastococcus sp. TF02A-30]